MALRRIIRLAILLALCIPLTGNTPVAFNPRVDRDWVLNWQINDNDMNDGDAFAVGCNPHKANDAVNVATLTSLCTFARAVIIKKVGVSLSEGVGITGDCDLELHIEGVAESWATIQVGTRTQTDNCEEENDSFDDGIDDAGDACIQTDPVGALADRGDLIHVVVKDGPDACDVITNGEYTIWGRWSS